MKTNITLHMLSEENYDHALELLKRITALRKGTRGLAFRRVSVDVKDKLRVITINAFQSDEAEKEYLKNPGRPTLIDEYAGGKRRVYEKTPSGNVLVFTHVDAETYEVDTEIVNKKINYKAWENRYTQFSYHGLHEKNRELGLEVLRKNTPIASKQKGFVSRQVYVGADKPLKAYSVTTWETLKDLEAFGSTPGRPVIVNGSDGMNYLKTDKGQVPVFPENTWGVFKTINEAYG